MILAGDLGGTKTVLALCSRGERPGTIRVGRSEQFANAEFVDDPRGFDAVLDRFLRERDADALEGACFGVAGPVDNGVANITNLPWRITASELTKRFGGIAVTLLNDLQATAYGALVVDPDRFLVLQPDGRRDPHGTISVIAPGTGLGEATLVWNGTRFLSLPSEGGHADFAPTTEIEIELLRFLRTRYGHVSYERVLSGDGIGRLYDFVRSTTTTREPDWLAHELASGDRNAAVSRAALADDPARRDPSCVRALELFVEVLGAEAGNLALRSVSTGGVVIGGGIPPRIVRALQSGGEEPRLITRFNDKGRFAPWTRTIGVRVMLEPRAALLGAAHYVATS